MDKFLYIPNSYNNDKISEKIGEYDAFLELQIKYRKYFEEYLKRNIDFDNIFKSINIDIPIVEDQEYNFYRKYSTLNSKYLYLRNNIHVENLDTNEITELMFNDECTDDFIKNTFERVLYENSDFTFVGVPIPSNLVNSKSIMFEFAYDQTKIENIEQYKNILNLVDSVKKQLIDEFKTKLDLDVFFVTYEKVSDKYKVSSDEEETRESINIK